MSAITSVELNALAHAGTQSTHERSADMAREFLSFRVGAEAYGVDILRVQEIRSYEAPLRFAGAPAVVKGVLHLRGAIVPVIDMRQYLGSPDTGHDAATVTIVLNVRGRAVGMVVDAVSDVTELRIEQIKPPPQFGSAINAHHLCGIAAVPGPDGDRMLILVDIEAVMSDPGLGLAGSI